MIITDKPILLGHFEVDEGIQSSKKLKLFGVTLNGMVDLLRDNISAYSHTDCLFAIPHRLGPTHLDSHTGFRLVLAGHIIGEWSAMQPNTILLTVNDPYLLLLDAWDELNLQTSIGMFFYCDSMNRARKQWTKTDEPYDAVKEYANGVEQDLEADYKTNYAEYSQIIIPFSWSGNGENQEKVLKSKQSAVSMVKNLKDRYLLEVKGE